MAIIAVAAQESQVSAKQWKLRFGTFREEALVEPIGVSIHGRISTVMISARAYEEYKRLKQMFDTRQALHPSELPEDIKAQMDEEGYQGKTTPDLDHLLDE